MTDPATARPAWADVESARDSWRAAQAIAARLRREYEALRDTYDTDYDRRRAAYLERAAA